MREPPAGLDVSFTDRGFEMEVVGALPEGASGCLRMVIPSAFLLEVVVAFICFGATLEGDVDFGPVLCLVAAVAVMSTGLGFVIWGRVSTPTRGRLVLDGDALQFSSTEGEIRMSLADIKAVDVIPVGLAIRPKRGMTHHVMMVQTDTTARKWLDDAIENARRRYGTNAEVPEELDALKKR